MVNAVKLAVVQTRCRPVHARRFTAGQKTVENQDRAAGPSWAAGRWTAGPSRVVGGGQLDLRAFGPPGGGPLGRGPVFSKTPGPGCSKPD